MENIRDVIVIKTQGEEEIRMRLDESIQCYVI